MVVYINYENELSYLLHFKCSSQSNIYLNLQKFQLVQWISEQSKLSTFNLSSHLSRSNKYFSHSVFPVLTIRTSTEILTQVCGWYTQTTFRQHSQIKPQEPKEKNYFKFHMVSTRLISKSNLYKRWESFWVGMDGKWEDCRNGQQSSIWPSTQWSTTWNSGLNEIDRKSETCLWFVALQCKNASADNFGIGIWVSDNW